MLIGDAAPTGGGDGSVDPPRKLKKTTEAGAGSSRGPVAASRPHGKDTVPPKPTSKRMGKASPARGKTTAKKARRVIPVASPKRAITTVIR